VKAPLGSKRSPARLSKQKMQELDSMKSRRRADASESNLYQLMRFRLRTDVNMDPIEQRTDFIECHCVEPDHEFGCHFRSFILTILVSSMQKMVFP